MGKVLNIRTIRLIYIKVNAPEWSTFPPGYQSVNISSLPIPINSYVSVNYYMPNTRYQMQNKGWGHNFDLSIKDAPDH